MSTLAVIGSSGSGRSTLLRWINGLEMIDDGSITVAGAQLLPDEVHLKSLRLKVGMIFQQSNQFAHHTAGGKIMLAQKVKKSSREEVEAIARRMLDHAGSAINLTPTRISRPAGSNLWRLQGHWPCNQSPCFAMRLRRHWIQGWSTRCLPSPENSRSMA